MKGKPIHTVLATAAIVALSGCAGLGAPVVTISKDVSSTKNTAACSKIEYPARSLDEAITYAGCWRSTYLKAAASHSRARTAVALTVLPAAALALYYSVTGVGSAKRVAALGAGGATAYGLGGFLTSKSAPTSYLNGALAMSCAIEAVTPDNLVQGSEGNLLDTLAKLHDAITAIEGHFAKQEAAVRSTPDYIETRYFVAEAKNVLELGRQRYLRVHNAGWRLQLTVDRIVAQVAQQVVDQEPGLDSLLQTVGSLKMVAQSIGLPPGVVASKGTSPAEPTGSGAVEKSIVSPSLPVVEVGKSLDALKSELHKAVAAVRGYLWTDALNTGPGDLSNCLPKQPVDAFAVVPSDPNHVVQVGKQLSFVINYPASSAFPTAATDRNTENFVEIVGPRPIDGKMTVTVTAKKATSGNDAVVLTIRDPSGRQSRMYQIQVIGDKKSPER
jgi:hypothetical protein